MKHTISIMALALAGGAMFSLPAQADGAGDWKGYAGSNCTAHSGANDVRRFTNGNLANYENSSTFVHCPLVRDIASGGDDRAFRARVRLYDNNDRVDGYCRLMVRTISGALFTWDHASWTGTGNKTLTLGPLDASNWGNYILYCSIPGVDGAKKSFIRSYGMDEKS